MESNPIIWIKNSVIYKSYFILKTNNSEDYKGALPN